MKSTNDKIRNRAEFLSRRCQGHEVRSVVITMLYDMELPLNSCGFSYLKNAVMVASSRPSLIVMKEIYEEVGKLYAPCADHSAIDSGIRDAVRIAWCNRRNDRWSYYFPESIMSREKPPSNAEIIAAMVYFVEMWQGNCKGVCYAEE